MVGITEAIREYFAKKTAEKGVLKKHGDEYVKKIDAVLEVVPQPKGEQFLGTREERAALRLRSLNMRSQLNVVKERNPEDFPKF